MQLSAPATFNRDIMRCKQALQGGRTIAVYNCLIDVAGSIKAAVFLSQLIYWTRHGVDVIEHDGWIYKTIQQMQDETGLTKREQGTCKDKLQQRNLIETRRWGLGARLELRVNLNELARAVCIANGIDEVVLGLPEIRQQTNLFFVRYFKKRLAYHRDLVTLTGCIHSALMLSYIMQQCVAKGAGNDKERWYISLSIDNWRHYLHLPYKTQLTARNKLKNRNFILEKHYFASRRIFTLVNGEAIWTALAQHTLPPPKDTEKPLSDMAWPRSDKSANTALQKGQNGSNKSANTALQKGQTGSDKPDNKEVTKGKIKKLQTGKLGSDKSGNSEVTKGEIVKDLDYIQFPYGNEYNHNNKQPGISAQNGEAVADVVVVDALAGKNEAGQYSGLIYPRRLKAMQNQCQAIFARYLPHGSQAVLQDILDEVEGQTKPVTSPLGLLTALTRLAGKDELICTVAPLVQQNRRRAESWAKQEEQRVAAERRQVAEYGSGNGNSSETIQDSISRMYDDLGIRRKQVQ